MSLSVPARPRFGQLVRVAAANIGVRLGWSIIDIDQLRIAVDESTGTLVGPVPQRGTLDANFEIVGDSLSLELTLTGITAPVPAARVDTFHSVVEPIVDSAKLDPIAGRVLITKNRTG